MKIVLHIDLEDMKTNTTLQDIQDCLQPLMKCNGTVKKL